MSRSDGPRQRGRVGRCPNQAPAGIQNTPPPPGNPRLRCFGFVLGIAAGSLSDYLRPRPVSLRVSFPYLFWIALEGRPDEFRDRAGSDAAHSARSIVCALSRTGRPRGRVGAQLATANGAGEAAREPLR